MIRTTSMLVILPIALLILSGCENNSDQRISELSQRYAEQQAEQSRQSMALQQEVVTIQRELYSQHDTLDHQRDLLEAERKRLASFRYWESQLGAVIHNLGLILLCLLPLAIGWLLLCRASEPVSDQEVADVLLSDLMSSEPQFSPTPLPRLTGSSPEAEASNDNTSGYLNP